MCKYGTVLLLVFLFVGWIIGVWTFLGKGLTQHKSSDLSHSNDNARSLTPWATNELIEQFYIATFFHKKQAN